MATMGKLKLFITFVLLFASGSFAELLVTHVPSTVELFDTASSLRLSEVQDVISSVFGYELNKDMTWNGLGAGDVFSRPKASVVFSVEGFPSSARLDVSHQTAYEVEYDEPELDTASVVNHIVNAADPGDKPLIVDFSVDTTVFEIRSHQPDLLKDVPATHDQLKRVFEAGNSGFSSSEIGSLNTTNDVDLYFLGEIYLIQQILSQLKQKSTDESSKSLPDFFHFKIRGIGRLSQEYGAESSQLLDAVNLLQYKLTQMTEELRSHYDDNVMVEVVTVPKQHVSGRSARSARHLLQDAAPTTAPEPQDHNLADNYDEMFPVIFNITLWLMVILGVALYGIAYGIWFMDPGRDSIIYRMTSQRIKKD